MENTPATSNWKGFRRWLFSISAFNRVIFGLALGIFTGLFFGESAGRLDIWGEAYIRLLQMTVLPYILVSLISGLGRLDAAIARRIGLMGGTLILLIWGITQVSNLLLSQAYPNWTTASFFSTSLVESGKPFDPLQLYVPSNPFYSMANAIVPAVVVFSILLGLALIAVPDKQHLLSSLSALSAALMRIASFVGKLAPLGIFAIAAAAAGTLRIEELSRLQVYLWTYLGAWTVITFWTLPALVAWATPLSYRDVLREARVPMVTAFATGTVLVVLPMIAERCKQLLERHKMKCQDTDAVIDVMVPTAYSFPSAGTLLGLGFIMFAAWYTGSPLGMTDYPAYVIVGAFVAFGSMAVAIPFMLDFFLPARRPVPALPAGQRGDSTVCHRACRYARHRDFPVVRICNHGATEGTRPVAHKRYQYRHSRCRGPRAGHTTEPCH
jgi:Na+/H+-dicarboxylate symporter